MGFYIKEQKVHIYTWKVTAKQKKAFEGCQKELNANISDTFGYLLHSWQKNKGMVKSTKSLSKPRNKIIKESELAKVTDIPFSDFYDQYPRKTHKIQAGKRWDALNPDAELFQVIIAHCTTAYAGKEKRFVPSPSTYLKNEKWKDEIVKYGDYVSVDQGLGKMAIDQEAEQTEIIVSAEKDNKNVNYTELMKQGKI